MANITLLHNNKTVLIPCQVMNNSRGRNRSPNLLRISIFTIGTGERKEKRVKYLYDLFLNLYSRILHTGTYVDRPLKGTNVS